MSDRYVVIRNAGAVEQVLCRRSTPPGTAWVSADFAGDEYYETIVLTKEGAEQMALNLGGTARQLVSPRAKP